MNETINGELAITLPDGFEPMSPNELKRLYTTDTEAIYGFRDEDRHIVIVVTWNVSNRLFTKIASVKDIAKRVEKAQARAMKGSGYRPDGFFDTTIAGQIARGVRFGYTTQGVDHDARAIVFLHGPCCYTLYCYSRSENTQSDATLLDAIFDSLAFNA